jgi:hypothetical protein
MAWKGMSRHSQKSGLQKTGPPKTGGLRSNKDIPNTISGAAASEILTFPTIDEGGKDRRLQVIFRRGRVAETLGKGKQHLSLGLVTA